MRLMNNTNSSTVVAGRVAQVVAVDPMPAEVQAKLEAVRASIAAREAAKKAAWDRKRARAAAFKAGR